MAKIIPARPYGRPNKTNRSFRAFCRVLKSLPDDFTAWLSLEHRSVQRPHVFLVWRERHAFLIQVAETTQQLAESALQGDFFQQNEALRPEDLGRPESDLLGEFVARSSDLLGPLAGELPLKRLVVFPNVSAGTVDEVVLLRSEQTHTSYLGWIKDHCLLQQEMYLAAERAGRGTSLRGSQRGEMWRLFRAYQNELRLHGATDWHNIALRFHEAAVVRASLAFPCYDAVFVDEAQFFARGWFEIVSAALKPGGHLFLAADPTQGFLRRRQSWVAAGIDVRGRTTRLALPYRNTRAILRFARDFYALRRDPAETETDLNVPDEAQLAAIADAGEAPVILRVPTAQDEIARAANEALALRQRGLPPGKLLILHANSSLEAALRSALERKLGRGQVHDAKSGPCPPAAFCTVTTLNAATGLEAAVVVLLGMDFLLESEHDARLSAEERGDLRRDHTRMLYMGFTRAGQRLVVLRSGGKESD